MNRHAAGGRIGRACAPWLACAAWAVLWPAATALAGEVAILQGGTQGSVVVDQSGSGNRLDVWQLQGRLDAVEAIQSGALNSAHLLQSAAGGDASRNLIVLRQAGTAGTVDVLQSGAGASASVFQSAQSNGDRATLLQSAIAPLGVIEQGVAAPPNMKPLDAAAEAVRVRSAALTEAASSQSSAFLSQAGGPGLVGIIVQSGSGQWAGIAQNGSYLEAQIVQAGGAHSASIAQAGAGTAASPYRASIVQLGAQPQGFSIQQTAGNAPRVIRVVQQ